MGTGKRIAALLLAAIMLLTIPSTVFAASVTISKNSMTIQTGDTYQLNVLADGSVVQAAAWGSSDTSVATVSNTGVVTGIAAGSAIITAMVEGTTVECLVSVVKRSTVSTARYNVLMLDASGSVKGTPLSRQKEAAVRFCDTVLSSSGENYIAVLSFSRDAEVLCGFTKDAAVLRQNIQSIHSGGGTNMNAAFTAAGDLLAQTPDGANVMKNVILCSDGIPKDGKTLQSGRYTKSDHKYFKYANITYETDVKLKNRGYFIYALGFFHNSSGNDLVFGKRLMKDLASKDKYYVITDPDDIDNVFDDIAGKITSTTMSKTSVTLTVGEKTSLHVQVNGASKKASWESADPSIASVNASGKTGTVTAKKAGKTTITGTVDGKSVTCKVTVKEKQQSKPTISVNPKSVTVYVREKVQLEATVTGKSQKVTWSSSDKSIAAVTKNGKVKGKKAGKAVITAEANGVKATCNVTVKIKHPVYSQYFMVDPIKSAYGDKKVDEYGVRLYTNEDAEVEKCAVYVKKSGNSYKRTIAFKGTNVTFAYYVPYLSKNGKVMYDGTTSSKIRTFSLRKDSTGIWSVAGSYDLITADLTDASGRQLTIHSKGVAGKNTKIFSDLSKMKKWLTK